MPHNDNDVDVENRPKSAIRKNLDFQFVVFTPIQVFALVWETSKQQKASFSN